jgi:dTDP-4-dehydrorhamnose reductase
MAVILVTGANGQLGSELRAASKKNIGYKYIFTDKEDFDLTDTGAISDFIIKFRPDWIINCAAYNQVDKAETDYEEARSINSTAVGNLAKVIRDTTCHFIHISTDYVYSGNGTQPFSEYSLPDPVNAYGRSKLEGEKNAFIHPWTMVIRTSWLYSSFGSNFVKTILKLGKEKKELRVVNDQTGSPTYAADLAQAILKIITNVSRQQIAFNAGIYNYSNEGSCTWYDFAVAILEEAGSDCKVIAVSSEEFASAARRPAFSVMNKSKIKENYQLPLSHWRDSLKKCIRKIKKNL